MWLNTYFYSSYINTIQIGIFTIVMLLLSTRN